MNKSDIKLLYQYNQWANRKILDASEKVSRELFLAPSNYPHGGLQGTLVHILFAEWIWRHRWEGASPTERLKPSDFPDFGSLRLRWEDEESLLMGFVESMTDARLASRFSYTSTEGKPYERVLWQTMVHVVNHGTQHRSEAAALLTDFGSSPGDFDFVYFLDEVPYQ